MLANVVAIYITRSFIKRENTIKFESKNVNFESNTFGYCKGEMIKIRTGNDKYLCT